MFQDRPDKHIVVFQPPFQLPNNPPFKNFPNPKKIPVGPGQMATDPRRSN